MRVELSETVLETECLLEFMKHLFLCGFKLSDFLIELLPAEIFDFFSFFFELLIRIESVKHKESNLFLESSDFIIVFQLTKNLFFVWDFV